MSARGEIYSGGSKVASCDFALRPNKTYTGSLDLGSLSFWDVYTGQIKIHATDTEDVEHTTFVNDDNISVLSYGDLSTYLEMLSGLKDVTILVEVKDEASPNLTTGDIVAFKNLGVDCDLIGGFG